MVFFVELTLAYNDVKNVWPNLSGFFIPALPSVAVLDIGPERSSLESPIVGNFVDMEVFVLQPLGWSRRPSPSITSLRPPRCDCVYREECVVLAALQQDGQTSFHGAPGVINSSPAQAAPSLIAHLIRSLYPSGHIGPINLCLVTVASHKYGGKQITLPGWIRVQTAI